MMEDDDPRVTAALLELHMHTTDCRSGGGLCLHAPCPCIARAIAAADAVMAGHTTKNTTTDN